jgi:peroxiredoxin
MIAFRCLVVVVLMALSTEAGISAEINSRVGQQIKDFSLRDFRGQEHSLSDQKNAKAIVVAFLGTECPLAKLYGPRLQSLSDKYESSGVVFIGINSNSQDSITELAAYARKHDLSFPQLKDVGNQVADQFDAKRTPEVFLLDDQHVVRYCGRIDDQYGIGFIRDEPKRNDLTISLDELLAGKPVRVAETESVGCHIGRIHKPDAGSKITYSNQIARILQKRCVECHRDGDIAPFALTEYEEVAGWAEMIAEVVEQKRMPPWHANPKFGYFANERRLTNEEKDLIFAWVEAGAPKGDPVNLPKPVEYLKGWQLSQKPDVVFDMRDEPFTVPAEGIVRYKYFRVDPGFEEDKWIKAAEVLPDNRAVVHHVLVFVRPPDGRGFGASGDFLVGYVPGLRARSLPDGMAKLIPAGSELIFQMHYTPVGSEQQDMSKVGLTFAEPKDVTHLVMTTKAAKRAFAIPPYAENHRLEATSRSHTGDLLLLSMMPHAHLRGKSFRYEAVLPDGKRETLLDVPAYDFNWQTSYRLDKPKTLAAGTKIHVVAHYDNSENNPANPDPSVTVRWGDQTWHEMMIGYFDIAIPRNELTVGASNKGDARKAIATRVLAAGLVKRYDVNKDGKVDRDEMPEKYKSRFDKINSNDDGGIDVEELTKALIKNS